MRVALLFSGLSVACAQSLTLLSNSRPTSSQPSSSSSLSSSARNATVSATVSSRSAIPTSSIISRNVSQSVFASAPWNVTSTLSPSLKPTAYVNPWAGNFSSPVPQHGTGSAYALQCQNAWFSFTSINTDDLKVSGSRGYTTQTIRSTTIYEVHTYYETQYYTLCDGHPRVITSTPSTTITTTLLPKTTTYLIERVGWEKYPDPNCTVNWDDCQGLWSRYSLASSVYNAISFEKANTIVSLGPGASYWVVNGVTTTFPTPSPAEISLGTESIEKYYIKGQYLIITTPPPGGLICACGKTMTAGGPPVTIQHTIDFTNTPYTPSCRTEKPTCTANQKCKISGDEVEIFWFPPQANATRDMCATAPPGPITSQPPTNYTWTPISTGPYAVMPGNTTWFSGNVYVSLKRINAQCNWSGTSVEVGSTQGGNILTMAPSELFSLRATLGDWGERGSSIDYGNNPYSFNFADLVSPYPWSAWAGLDHCVVSKCSTMNGLYNPRIAVPEAIRRLDPRWSTCDLDLGGLYDPPIALSSVGNMFATTTVPPQAGPAPTPGQSPPQQNEPTRTPIVPGAPLPWQDDPADPLPPAKPPINSGPPPSDDEPLTPGKPDDPSGPSQPGNPNGNPQPAPAPAPIPDSGQNNPDPARPQLTPTLIPPQPTTIGSIGTIPIVINLSNPSQINIGTTTLTPGASALTIGTGTTISLRDPSHIVISTPGAAAPSTINVPQGGAPMPSAGAIITLPNGEHITVTAIIGEGHDGERTATSVLVSGTMFSVGAAPITLSNGLVLSQAPSGSGVIVIDSGNAVTSTIAFSAIPGIYTTPTITPAPSAIVTIGGRTYTATSRGGSVVIPGLGITLSQGGPDVTVDGTVISDAGGRTGVVVGSSTATFPSGSGSATGNAAIATGEGTKARVGWRRWRVGVGILGGLVMRL